MHVLEASKGDLSGLVGKQDSAEASKRQSDLWFLLMTLLEDSPY